MIGRRFLASGLSLGLVFSLVACTGRAEWTEFRGKDGSGRAASLVNPPIGIKWQLLLQKQQLERRFFNQPLLVDGAVYFGSADGNFYSLNLASGYMNWTFRSGGPINSVAHVDATKVYFGSADGNVYALDRETGEAVWQFETGGQVNSTVKAYRDLIIVASDADAVYFISREGELRFSLPNEVWYHNAFQVFDGRMTYAPGSDELPYSQAVYDIDQRRYLWTQHSDVDQYIWFSFPAVNRQRLHCSAVGLDDDYRMKFRFACYDFNNGYELWSTEELSQLWRLNGYYIESVLFWASTHLLDYAAPVLWRKRVIYAVGDQVLRCFEAAKGAVVWQRDYERPIATPPTLSGDRLYFGLHTEAMTELDHYTDSDGNPLVVGGSRTGSLVCASAATGKPLWKIDIEGTILNSPVITGRWIIFGTDGGYFYVLEELY